MTYTFTGTDWSNQEEQAIAFIQKVSRLNRIQAIQLWKRHGKKSAHAVKIAKEQYPPYTAEQQARFDRAGSRLKAIRATNAKS